MVLLHSDDPGTPISDRYRKTPCKDCFVGGLKWACSYAVYICGVPFKEGFVEYLFLWSFFFLLFPVEYSLQKCFVEYFIAESFFCLLLVVVV